MKILQLSVHFAPNVGGVETHLSDLVKALARRRYKVFVLTYRPLVAKTPWETFEKKKRITILRLPWVPGFFYKLSRLPLFQFIYLVPGIFLVTPFILLFDNPEIIHTHGLISSFVGVFWGKVFGKKVVTTTHSIYHFPQKGLYRQLAKWVFGNSNYILTLSKQSKKEMERLGLKPNKVKVFTYWVDLDKFKAKRVKPEAKKRLGWENKFVVLFVGRLVPEKGIVELLRAAEKWDENITLAIAGSGPMESKIKKQKPKSKNLKYLGRIDNDKLPDYYSAANLVIVPSTHEEGFGRVILESLACGTPVIGSNRGAIPEAMDETVGKLIDVTPGNIVKSVEYFYKNLKRYKQLSENSRKYAEKNYSKENVEKIIAAYG